MLNNKVQVALVDDSPIALYMLNQIIAKDERLEVLWSATSAKEALQKLEENRPDILCTDYHMPDMDGIQLIEQIMVQQPLPTMLVSVSVQKDERVNVFHALEAGAVDIFPKPRGHADFSHSDEKALCDRIYLVSKVRVIKKHRSSQLRSVAQTQASPPTIESVKPSDKIVALGGSTGAPSIYFEILSSLPAKFPVPIVCVQHIGKGFVQSFVDWLNSGSLIDIKVAEHGEILRPGSVYFAPDDCQFGIRGGSVFLDYSDPISGGHKPSIDYLFKSLTDYHSGVAVLLSGMGGDGAQGMLALQKQGFQTIGQSESSSTIYGIPKVAKELGAIDIELDAKQIAAAIQRLVGNSGK